MLRFNFESPENDPVPSMATSQWIFNGQLLPSTDRITLGLYNISFTSVERTEAGVYELNVSNDAGSAISNLTLDVQCEYDTNFRLHF